MFFFLFVPFRLANHVHLLLRLPLQYLQYQVKVLGLLRIFLGFSSSEDMDMDPHTPSMYV